MSTSDAALLAAANQVDGAALSFAAQSVLVPFHRPRMFITCQFVVDRCHQWRIGGTCSCVCVRV